MKTLGIILLVILVIILLLMALLILPLPVTVMFDEKKLKVKIGFLTVFKSPIAKLIASVINNPKPKIKINVRQLLSDIQIKKIVVTSMDEIDYQIDAVLYGIVGIFTSMRLIDNVDFIYQKKAENAWYLLSIYLKVSVGKILIHQIMAQRRMKYGE